MAKIKCLEFIEYLIYKCIKHYKICGIKSDEKSIIIKCKVKYKF